MAERPSDIMTPPTQDEKREAAASRIKTHLRHMEAAYKEGLGDPFITFMKMELDGGNCPECKTPWKEINYDNIFGRGRYFEPACICQPVCQCGPEWHPIRYLYREWAADKLIKVVPKGKYLSFDKVIEIPRSKVMQCTNCDSILEVIETVPEKKSDAKEYIKQKTVGKKMITDNNNIQ